MAKPDVHRAINVVLDDDVHDLVHDSSRPKAERAQALLDHLTESGEGLGHHWTTDPKMAPFFHDYNAHGPHTTNVIFHAAHPEDHEIITDPGWREEHEVNDSEDEVPVHSGTDMEIKGISWKRHGDKEFTRHDFDDPDYYTASLRSRGMVSYFEPRGLFPSKMGNTMGAGINDYFGGGHGGTAPERRVAGRGKPRRNGGGDRPAAPGAGGGGAPQGQQRGQAADPGGAAPAARSVEFHPQVAKDLRALDKPVQKQILGVVDSLAAGDTNLQTHALTQKLSGWYSTKASRGHRIVHRPTDDGGIHVGYIGLHDYDKAIRRLTKLNREPGPVTFPYLRNTEQAGYFGGTYGQDVEPHGRYLTYHDGPKPDGDRWEAGEVSFKNPLHMDFGGGYGDESNWKHQLSRQFGGKKGKALSRAVVRAGHDAIITHDEYGPSEIVDLTSFRRTAAKRQCECCGGVGEHGMIECYACDSSGTQEGPEIGTRCQRQCPCGLMAEYDPQDGWQHLDGSVTHDDPEGTSVSDLMKFAGAQGGLPEGLHFKIREATGGRRYHKIDAHVPGRKEPIGSMMWDAIGDEDDPDTLPGEVFGLRVEPEYRRRGVANAMWDHARRHGPTPDPQHSLVQTEEGAAWARQKIANHPSPTSRVFGPTYGLDHRLFEGEHLRPEVRTAVMARLGPVIEPVLGDDWQRYTKVYLAGSEASEWTSETLEGNGDFDTLIGVDYDALKGEPGVPVADLDDQDITDELNKALRENYNASPWKAPFGGEWDLTGYVNAGSYDIRRIKPYAAYNITDDEWAVRPPHLPDWSIDKLPEGGQNLLDEAEGYAAIIEAIDKMPEPFRTQQGKALWHHLHSDRGRAFSDEGEGWLDPGNLIEKALVEWGLWDKLVEWQYGKQKTAATREYCDTCDTEHDYPFDEDDHYRSYTDWDKVYPRIPSEIHRGMAVQLDPSEHRAVHDHNRSEADRAHVLMGAMSRRSLGMHWTANEPEVARQIAGEEADHLSPRERADTTQVVLHADKPAREHVEDDIRRLVDGSVISWHSGNPEAEVPLKENAPVHVWGVSWKHQREPGWHFHEFEQPMKRTAGARGDLPELTFKHLSPEENHPYGGAEQDTHTLHAYTADGRHAGELSWFGEDGMIRDVKVPDALRRRGIASELLSRARQIQPSVHHSDALTSDGAGWARKVSMLEYFAVKRSDHPLAPDLPEEQADALGAEDYTEHKRKMLDLAKNPVPGTHIWRGELRAADPVKSARETGVGIHWGVNPDTIVRPQAFEGEHEVVYHAEIEHPGEQNFSRSHPMWQGRHMSMDSEAEVRLKPGSRVKLHGVWYSDPYVSDKGYFTPTKPERMGKQWSYTPINEYVQVAHRPSNGLIDYGDVGVKHEGVLEYFKIGMGANGSLPEGLTFRHEETPYQHQITAETPEDGEIGYLFWSKQEQPAGGKDENCPTCDRYQWDVGHKHPAGEIEDIDVVPAHRRKGVGRAMLQHARQLGVHPAPVHSDVLTDDGRAWAEKNAARHTAMPAKNYPPPEDFSHHIEDLDSDDNDFGKQEEDWPGWHHRILYGKSDGKIGGHIVFSENPKGTAISVGKMETYPSHRGKGLASAMQDALAEEHPTHWINHGSRTGAGRQWWDSYEDPAPDRNIHNVPHEMWQDDFDIGREHDDPRRVFGEDERPRPEGGLKYSDVEGKEGFIGGAVRWRGPEGREDHAMVHDKNNFDHSARADVLLNAAQQQGALQHGRWHEDPYEAEEHADELSTKLRQGHDDPVTHFIVRKNEDDEFPEIMIRDHKPGTQPDDNRRQRLEDLEYDYHPIHDKLKKSGALLDYFGMAA